MGDENILDLLLEPKLMALLRYFIDNPGKQYYLREIAKKVKVPPASALRILRRLCRIQVIEEIRIKNIKLYQLQSNEQTKFLDGIISTKKSALDEFIKLIQDIPGLDQVLLHGKESAEKASLLIVGRDVDVEQVKRAALDIKEKYKYDILYLTLEMAQFDQMTAMGLYPGKKVLLFSRQHDQQM